MWVSIFGNSAIEITRSGDERFREIAMNQPQQGFYTLLQEFSAFPLVASRSPPSSGCPSTSPPPPQEPS